MGEELGWEEVYKKWFSSFEVQGRYGGRWVLIGWAAVFDTVVFTGRNLGMYSRYPCTRLASQGCQPMPSTSMYSTSPEFAFTTV